jgi:DNA helicase II / ATP-dependent DNA helicase PcrA
LARTRALVGDGAGQVQGGTFHAVAHQVVRTHAAALGLPPRFRVFDAGDAADLIDLIREENGLAEGKKRFPRKGTLLDIYSRSVNTRQRLSDVIPAFFPWCEDYQDEIARLCGAYVARKRQLGVLDLDDLLLSWHALACDPTVGPRLAGAFDAINVDEYQDLNQLQVEIVRALRPNGEGLMVVGDDSQSVYGFRGASVEHIIAFPEQFPDATVVTLVRNYRSTQPILDLANVIARDAARGFPKRLRAEQYEGRLPRLLFCLDEAQQAEMVCARVLDKYEQGTPLVQQAVLMRAGHHSNLLELVLDRNRVPFVKFGGIRYLDAAHVKDFVALLRLADSPGDMLSWFRILQLHDGVGPVTARRVVDELDLPTLDTAASLRDRWEAAGPLLKEPLRKAVTPLIETLASCSSDDPVSATVEKLHAVAAPLVRAHYPDGATRLRDLDRLAATAAQASSLSGFLADLALDPPASSADYAGKPVLDEDYLTLSTVHSAKGLEWDAVHVIGATDGNFPSDMALNDPDGLEEERRLFYVAITRPRKTLAIYVPLRYYHHPNARDDNHGYGKQSRFITPEAESLCERTDTLVPETSVWAGGDPAAAKVDVDLAHLWR